MVSSLEEIRPLEKGCLEQRNTIRRDSSNDDFSDLVQSHEILVEEYLGLLSSLEPDLAFKAIARMWVKGIEPFVALLGKLPQASEHLIRFLYESYRSIGCLYEKYQHHKLALRECLGDLAAYLARYNKERSEEWRNIASDKYNSLVHITPEVGRLFYRLALLAKGNKLEQMQFLYRSLGSKLPFEKPVALFFEGFPTMDAESQQIDVAFVIMHIDLFRGRLADLHTFQRCFLERLQNHIQRDNSSRKNFGIHLAIINVTPLYRPLTNFTGSRSLASDLAFSTLKVVLRYERKENALPHVHILLSFLLCLTTLDGGAIIADKAPWKDICIFVNSLSRNPDSQAEPRLKSVEDLLPEDHIMHGQFWAQEYPDEKWFKASYEHEIVAERSSMEVRRINRIRWLIKEIATVSMQAANGILLIYSAQTMDTLRQNQPVGPYDIQGAWCQKAAFYIASYYARQPRIAPIIWCMALSVVTSLLSSSLTSFPNPCCQKVSPPLYQYYFFEVL